MFRGLLVPLLSFPRMADISAHQHSISQAILIQGKTLKLVGDGNIKNKAARPSLIVGQEHGTHIVSDSHIGLNLSPETRDITQTMWSTVPTALEDSDTTGNYFTGLFR